MLCNTLFESLSFGIRLYDQEITLGVTNCEFKNIAGHVIRDDDIESSGTDIDGLNNNIFIGNYPLSNDNCIRLEGNFGSPKSVNNNIFLNCYNAMYIDTGCDEKTTMYNNTINNTYLGVYTVE